MKKIGSLVRGLFYIGQFLIASCFDIKFVTKCMHVKLREDFDRINIFGSSGKQVFPGTYFYSKRVF